MLSLRMFVLRPKPVVNVRKVQTALESALTVQPPVMPGDCQLRTFAAVKRCGGNQMLEGDI